MVPERRERKRLFGELELREVFEIAILSCNFFLNSRNMTAATCKPYPSDFSDAQWNILAPLIPPKIGRGENRKVDIREVVNAIFYQLCSGA